MKCPNCNKVYSEDNVFCVDCGTRLIDDETKIKQGTPIERFSTRVKTSSKPKTDPQHKSEPQPNDIPADCLHWMNFHCHKTFVLS